MSGDGSTLVYARSAQSHPPTLLACKVDGSAERIIETFNKRLLTSLQMGEARSVAVKGFGGHTVQMWIVSPPGYSATTKKKWPLMQVIHGGPHTCWNDTWHWRWNMQMFAAAGYVVAAVNYHGSSGFGQKFLSSINGDWGRRELADVEAGTDYMLATGTIDPHRMVATGGSYGGYMVAYMNGHVAAKRYQAYVCHAGCYDWVSMMGSDGYFWFGHELGAFHWDDEARVLKQSPHHYAQNFATPTLVVHGEQDYRVPYYQGLAYYNTLRARNVPSRLVFFPDENHWILKPQNSRLWYREFTNWCDRFTSNSVRIPKAARSLT
ncbi:S9 family peptidase [Candidatus Aalborgicola defluviihabitans]|uniref:S9 family peptidase n=1 Tax=Candidatus Aalborgicola defluviihabitans TaxID=3386187 RepID=UPI001D828691|nr:S9 family peptidase [Burkholderiales bacterium]